MDDKLLLELDLEFELELLSSTATTTSVGVWTARMGATSPKPQLKGPYNKAWVEVP